MIDLYFSPTPNGWKAAIMLEEAGLDYRVILMRLSEGDQFAPEFLAISPNAKMPAIVDHAPEASWGDDPVTVFESGPVLLYLADKTGQFAPDPGDLRARKELMEWLFWQVGNQGPMAGQLSHFRNYAPEADRAYGFKRYLGEYDRNLGVLENRLEDRDYLLDDYSIADMLAFPWVFIAKPLGGLAGGIPACRRLARADQGASGGAARHRPAQIPAERWAAPGRQQHRPVQPVRGISEAQGERR